MPAQLDPPSPGPQPLLLAGPSALAGGQGVLFWFVFPLPHFFFSPVFFVSLALGMGVATFCWLSDFWAIALD